MQQRQLTELENTDLKYTAAQAKVTELEARLANVTETSREAQRNLTAARERVTRERQLLSEAQQSLVEALYSGKSEKAIQQQVSGHRSNIDALEQLVIEATKEAADRDHAIANVQITLGRAQSEVEQARYFQLVVALAKAITPAIPICRELVPMSHRLGTPLTNSGYVLNLQRPNIGHYTIADDGGITFLMR